MLQFARTSLPEAWWEVEKWESASDETFQLLCAYSSENFAPVLGIQDLESSRFQRYLKASVDLAEGLP